MKLLKAMFTVSILLKIVRNMFIVGVTVAIYLLGFTFLTQYMMGGNMNIGEFAVTSLMLFIAWYGMFIFLPFYLFLKLTYESELYLTPLANAYGIKLSPVKVELKRKEKRKIGLYIFTAAIFALFVIIISIKKAPYLVVIGLIPFYIMIYKNWIKGLYLALGEAFKGSYEEDKKVYIVRASLFIILMHIPIFWFFQPWVLQSLANIYFKKYTKNIKLYE